MTIYGEDAYLYLAKVNLPKRLAQFKEQLLQIQKDLSETPSHQKKSPDKAKSTRSFC